jgi:hypothetical protein
MLEVDVVLELACGHCHRPITVKLKCSGKGLEGGLHQAAAVRIPCPHCEDVNQVVFEPSGLLLDVQPCRPRPLEPSLN